MRRRGTLTLTTTDGVVLSDLPITRLEHALSGDEGITTSLIVGSQDDLEHQLLAQRIKRDIGEAAGRATRAAAHERILP